MMENIYIFLQINQFSCCQNAFKQEAYFHNYFLWIVFGDNDTSKEKNHPH